MEAAHQDRQREEAEAFKQGKRCKQMDGNAPEPVSKPSQPVEGQRYQQAHGQTLFGNPSPGPKDPGKHRTLVAFCGILFAAHAHEHLVGCFTIKTTHVTTIYLKTWTA
jgi:hypothetical protein